MTAVTKLKKSGGSGFTRKKTYVLEFEEGSEFFGLEVKVRPVTIGEMLEITDMVAWDNNDLRPLFARFADALVSWNIETEEGDPVPADFDGVCTQDADMIMELISAWQDAVTGKVKGPKEARLTDGSLLEVASIPMDISSVDRES